MEKVYIVTLSPKGPKIFRAKREDDRMVINEIVFREKPDASKNCNGRPMTGPDIAGHIIGVTKNGLLVYDDFHGTHPRPECAILANRKGATPPVVAVFADPIQAFQCTEEKEHRVLDPRWRSSTIAILNRHNNNGFMLSSVVEKEFNILPA